VPYKIAVTSSDGEHIDLHFGMADSFRILQMDEAAGSWEFQDTRKIPVGSNAAPGCGGCGHQDERLQSVINALSDCRYVFTARIGKKPFTVLQRAGITALEVPSEIPFAVSKLHAYHRKQATIKRN
jgi:predicted Fe-Mo cluster-binding NifX family protein